MAEQYPSLHGEPTTDSAEMTSSESFEFYFGDTRFGDPIPFEENGEKWQAESFELKVDVGDATPDNSKSRYSVGEMVKAARAAGYRFTGICPFPSIPTLVKSAPITPVQVYLERPVPPTPALDSSSPA